MWGTVTYSPTTGHEVEGAFTHPEAAGYEVDGTVTNLYLLARRWSELFFFILRYSLVRQEDEGTVFYLEMIT